MSDNQQNKVPQEGLTRREMLRGCGRAAAIIGAGGLAGLLARTARATPAVWQIDPHKCVQCGKCATYCVLPTSAVRCVHAFAMCGYCRVCFGYFDINSKTQEYNTAAENQICPTGAIGRLHVESQYFQYTIEESLCIGCGKCVASCGQYGNGSLYLQIKHDLCVHCNQCSIATACPSGAISRVGADKPYLFKDAGGEAEPAPADKAKDKERQP